MFSRRLKTGYFLLEGLNSFATVYYFYYLYFFMQQVHGFGNKSNLMLAALNGATYAAMSWFGGRFAQRYGYFTALKTGYSIMILALSMGFVVESAPGHVCVMVLTVIGMSFTWPTLEALVSENETRAGLQHMVGVYNLVWASTAALANFSGGAMLQKLGFSSLFSVPIAVNLSQLGLTLWLQNKVRGDVDAESGMLPAQLERAGLTSMAPSERPNEFSFAKKGELTGKPGVSSVLDLPVAGSGPKEVSVAVAKRFLGMAWLANPFAYIAINTLIAVVPGVARRLELSTMAAGFCCSTWCFARVGAFAVLWQWTRWHYRFRWLLLAFVGLVGSFGAVVLTPNVMALVLSQLIFGGAVGLIYYSSLFYSMDRSETKGEHGGIHESAIGLGNCAGPAVGAAALQLVPQYVQSGTIAVIALLLCGLGGLIWIWRMNSVSEP